MSYARQTQKITYSKKHRLPEKAELPRAVKTRRVKKARF